jgi:hypothetical protein
MPLPNRVNETLLISKEMHGQRLFSIPGISLMEIGGISGNGAGTPISGVFSLRLRVDGKYSIEVGDRFNP